MLDDFSINKIPTKQQNKKTWSRFTSPIAVRWDLTYLCNFQCIHCYSSCGYDKNKQLSLDNIKKIIDILDKEKVQFVQILWGEPMVYPKILEVIAYALTKKFIFCINSNGYLLNDTIIHQLSKMWLQHIQISLNGLGQEHDQVTMVKESFEKVSKNVEKLIASWMNVSISCVVSEINKGSIFKFLEYIIGLWVKNIQLLTPLDEGRAKQNKFYLQAKDYKKLKKNLIEFKNKNTTINLDLPWFDIDVIDGLVNTYQNDQHYEFMFWCMWWVSWMRIDPLWNACICVWWVGKPIANLLKEPIKDIMEKLHEWRVKNVCKMCEWCPSYLEDCQWACYLRFWKDK